MYDIKIWETEEDREMGESFIYESFKQLDEAKSTASKLWNSNNLACIEVQDTENENNTLFHQSSPVVVRVDDDTCNDEAIIIDGDEYPTINSMYDPNDEGHTRGVTSYFIDCLEEYRDEEEDKREIIQINREIKKLEDIGEKYLVLDPR